MREQIWGYMGVLHCTEMLPDSMPWHPVRVQSEWYVCACECENLYHSNWHDTSSDREKREEMKSPPVTFVPNDTYTAPGGRGDWISMFQSRYEPGTDSDHVMISVSAAARGFDLQWWRLWSDPSWCWSHPRSRLPHTLRDSLACDTRCTHLIPQWWNLDWCSLPAWDSVEARLCSSVGQRDFCVCVFVCWCFLQQGDKE